MSGEVLFAAELTVSGLLVGVMYSLVALGFVLIYKASAVFNFAQGAMTLFAALALVGYLPYVGLAGGLMATLVLMALLALGIERIILRPLVARPPLSLFMATIGLGFFLEGLSQAVWGTQPKGLDIGIPDTPFEVAGIFISRVVSGWRHGRRRAGGGFGMVLSVHDHRAWLAGSIRRSRSGAGGWHPASAGVAGDLDHRWHGGSRGGYPVGHTSGGTI